MCKAFFVLLRLSFHCKKKNEITMKQERSCKSKAFASLENHTWRRYFKHYRLLDMNSVEINSVDFFLWHTELHPCSTQTQRPRIKKSIWKVHCLLWYRFIKASTSACKTQKCKFTVGSCTFISDSQKSEQPLAFLLLLYIARIQYIQRRAQLDTHAMNWWAGWTAIEALH